VSPGEWYDEMKTDAFGGRMLVGFFQIKDFYYVGKQLSDGKGSCLIFENSVRFAAIRELLTLAPFSTNGLSNLVE